MVESRTRNVCVRVLAAVAMVITTGPIVSCEVTEAYLGDRACFYLEVANRATDPVTALIFIGNLRFHFPAAALGGQEQSPDSGVIRLQGGGRRIFEVCSYGITDSDNDNVNLRHFGGIRLEPADDAARQWNYTYELVGCGDGGAVTACDDAALIYRRSDGIMDKLFVESPNRPFYLERERWDHDVGRLVITFAPKGR